MSNLLKEMKIDSSSHGHRKRALNLIINSLEQEEKVGTLN